MNPNDAKEFAQQFLKLLELKVTDPKMVLAVKFAVFNALKKEIEGYK